MSRTFWIVEVFSRRAKAASLKEKQERLSGYRLTPRIGGQLCRNMNSADFPDPLSHNSRAARAAQACEQHDRHVQRRLHGSIDLVTVADR